MALLYIVLGTSGSGRREVIMDIIRHGIDLAKEQATVYIPEDETTCEIDDKLNALPNVTVNNWALVDDQFVSTESLKEGQELLFFLVNGRKNPIDQLEAIHDWAKQQTGVEMGRIYTVLNSQLASTVSGVKAWYDACIHFSDIVLFNKREDVPNKWFKDFEAIYHKLCFPCLFDIVKKGHVKNATSILFPEARRMSQAFDDLDPEFQDPTYGYDIDTSDDEEEDEEDAIPKEAYFEKLVSGHRIKRIPDINKFLA